MGRKERDAQRIVGISLASDLEGLQLELAGQHGSLALPTAACLGCRPVVDHRNFFTVVGQFPAPSHLRLFSCLAGIREHQH